MTRVESELISSGRPKLSPFLNDDDSSTIVKFGEDEKIAPRNPKEAVEHARDTFKSGRTRPLKFRKDQLRALIKFLAECKEQMVEALYEDLRKHRQEAIMNELDVLENDARHTLYDLDEWMGPHRVEKRLVNLLDGLYIVNDPYGVVLIIGAWNYPFLLTIGPMIGAIAGGNCVVLKPSELSPATSRLMADLLPKYLDPDALAVIEGGVPETTELLAIKFDYIFFTGSTAVGKIVHKAAAINLTPATLELGGKSPVYLDDTVDLTVAARRIFWGKLINAGQTCVSPDYLLCTEAVQNRFLEVARKVLIEFYGEDSKTPYVSKIVTERHFDRLAKFVAQGRVALGGILDAKTRIISPTVLTDVRSDDAVMQEEIFGPILPIVTVKDVWEAVEYINARDKPLALYVFSTDRKVQNLILENTSSGGVAVNDTVLHLCTENLPFGGVGASGMGSYHGRQGFETFTHQKSVLKRSTGMIAEVAMAARYPPYTDFKTGLGSFALKKRRGIPLKYLKTVAVFGLGVGVTFALQSLF